MNKAAGIGAVIAVIIGIIIVSATFSMDSSVEDKGSVSEKVVIEESIEEKVVIEESIEELEVVEEEVVIEESIEEPEVVEEEGKDFTVELTETIGLKGP